MRDTPVVLSLVQQGHPIIVMCPWIVWIQLYCLTIVRHRLFGFLLDVVEEKAELAVGLHILGVQLQSIAVLFYRVFRVTGLEELVGGPDEGIVIQELLLDLLP